jgi:hypothetical protein
LTGDEAFEVPGIHIDLGQLDAGQVIGPVDPVVVQESTTDDVPLVDDRRSISNTTNSRPSDGRIERGRSAGPAPASSSDVRRDRTEAL